MNSIEEAKDNKNNSREEIKGDKIISIEEEKDNKNKLSKETKGEKIKSNKESKGNKIYCDYKKFKGNTFETNINSIIGLLLWKTQIISNPHFIYVDENDDKNYISAIYFIIRRKEKDVKEYNKGNKIKNYYPHNFIYSIFFYDNKFFYIIKNNNLLIFKLKNNNLKKYVLTQKEEKKTQKILKMLQILRKMMKKIL